MLETLVGHATNELKELDELQALIRLPLSLFVENGHLTETEAEVDVFLTNVKCGISCAHIDEIFELGERLRRRPILIIDLL